MPLSYGAMTIAVSERYLGRKVTISGAYAVVLKQWYKYVLTSLLVGIVIGGLTLVGLVLLVLPGIAVFVLLCVWFMFFIPVIACEGTWWTGALRRSKELVTGYWGRVFGIWLLVGLIRMVVSAALTAPAQLLTIGLAVAVDEVTAQAVGQSLGTLAQMLVDPILSIAIVLMYYDLRIRKEAFDLEVLAQEISGGQYVPPAAEPAKPASLFSTAPQAAVAAPDAEETTGRRLPAEQPPADERAEQAAYLPAEEPGDELPPAAAEAAPAESTPDAAEPAAAADDDGAPPPGVDAAPSEAEDT